MTTTPIYLDYAATTPLHPAVYSAMQPYLTTQFENPHSQHQGGFHLREVIESSRAKLAHFFGCSPETLTFTSGGTESNNLCLFGVMRQVQSQGKGLIVSATEHSAVLEPARSLAKVEGVPLLELKPDATGRICPDDLARALRQQPTALVSILHANNETGALNDIATLSQVAHEAGAFFHTDAVQSAGKLPIDLEHDFPHVDYLTATAHKLYGARGAGVLFHRATAPRPQPIILGGGQESGLRGGTLNTPAIVSFATAVERLALIQADYQTHLEQLTIRLMTGIEAMNTAKRIQFNTPKEPSHRVAGIVNCSVEGVSGEKMVMQLNMKGIAVSSGSACHGDKVLPSHVILAQHGDVNRALNTLRVSVGEGTSVEDIEQFLNVFEERLSKWK